MSSIKKQFENEEEYFKRLEIFLKSIEKGYNPRDRYELINECNTLII